MDIIAQFTINFLEIALKNPNDSPETIALKAWNEVKVKDAVLGGMVSFTSLDNRKKELISACAIKLFRRLQDGGAELAINIGKGMGDCFIEVSLGLIFNSVKKTDAVKKLIKELQDGMNADIALRKLKGIIGSAEVYNMVQKMITNTVSIANK